MFVHTPTRVFFEKRLQTVENKARMLPKVYMGKFKNVQGLGTKGVSLVGLTKDSYLLS
jgi:hypothetical protein